ncbi:MAG: hypothetical protein EXR92_03795 [Gemmatimonadetes bacterium]|nr:hypothetical protein [Gemmatimonadota bacterium]
MKATEIVVRGLKDEPVLHGQRREVGIRDEVGLASDPWEQGPQDRGMTLGWLWHPDGPAREPLSDLGPRPIEGHGFSEDATIRDDPVVAIAMFRHAEKLRARLGLGVSSKMRVVEL